MYQTLKQCRRQKLDTPPKSPTGVDDIDDYSYAKNFDVLRPKGGVNSSSSGDNPPPETPLTPRVEPTTIFRTENNITSISRI